ncbi:hypothetical protein BIZ94_gp004 [Pseudomonas phage vB_PaeM_MAG1]|uniref:Uncharacterized protein n=1 Tax=Pseudomonas phage vB_PaeM_MAG1 TaxID=1639815 RepID=A0A172EK17_9CAUD|nr:hypothetical protein BIZ94_gp004 [Pseudomonas phage vB_PaeM_MAG1]ALA11984.1 hypothetical protein vB_PaeM_MAG1_004 [Pseudomonas phage vB_PaeM_MAG1]
MNNLPVVVCLKCGAINGGQSKHNVVVALGKKWCGHCGSNLATLRR